MKVYCKVVQAESDKGQALLRAECMRCSHSTESFGTGENSRKRCLATMREECPNNETNFYVDEDEEED